MHEVTSSFPKMDLDGDTLVMTDYTDQHTVKINALYELFLDGERVLVPKEAKPLLEKFYVAALKLHRDSLVVGIQGAKAGKLGQLIAKDALEQVAKALGESSIQETNDQPDPKKLGKLLTESTEGIEKRVREITDRVDEMREMAKTLNKMIPKLNAIGWFNTLSAKHH